LTPSEHQAELEAERKPDSNPWLILMGWADWEVEEELVRQETFSSAAQIQFDPSLPPFDRAEPILDPLSRHLVHQFFKFGLEWAERRAVGTEFLFTLLRAKLLSLIRGFVHVELEAVETPPTAFWFGIFQPCGKCAALSTDLWC
jgi:hypothetical protein